MPDIINVEQINAVYLKINTESSVKFELEAYFKFQPQGYQFNPSYKNRVWDGWIRIFHPMKSVLYVGLFSKLRKFCEDRGYELNAPDHLMNGEKVPDDYGYEMAR